MFIIRSQYNYTNLFIFQVCIFMVVSTSVNYLGQRYKASNIVCFGQSTVNSKQKLFFIILQFCPASLFGNLYIIALALIGQSVHILTIISFACYDIAYFCKYINNHYNIHCKMIKAYSSNYYLQLLHYMPVCYSCYSSYLFHQIIIRSDCI